jgi:glyoxylase I family protein
VIAEFYDGGLPKANQEPAEIAGRSGGRQIQVEDPDGNPIELFEPAR